MIKKILYIAFKYEYGKKENGHALNYKAWYENFLRLGYEVDTIFYESYSREELQVKIQEHAEKYRPDIIFFVLQKNQVDVNTLMALKDKGFFTVNFFGDDQWRFETFTSKFAPHLTACITTDKYSIDKYYKIGQNNVITSQWASLESVIDSPTEISYQYDVSFVGGINPYRKWFVKALADRGINVHCFGSGWDNGRVSYTEMAEIFKSSKINLNISNSTNYDVRYLLSNLKSIVSTIKSLVLGGKNNSQTKARNFEIPVYGGMELTDYVPSLEDYFNIGHELLCYNTVEDAEKIIKYYLIHESARELIKIAGIKKAKENHTFKHRVVGFMNELEEIKENGNAQG